MKYLKQFESFGDYYTYQDIDAECFEVLDILNHATGFVVWMINPEEVIECKKRGWIKPNKNQDYILDTDLEEVEEFLEDFRYAKKHGVDIDTVKQSRKYNL